MSEGHTDEPIRISVDEAKRRYEEEDVTVLDVVDSESYEDYSHKVEDAVRINPENIKEEYDRLPEDRPVLTY